MRSISWFTQSSLSISFSSVPSRGDHMTQSVNKMDRRLPYSSGQAFVFLMQLLLPFLTLPPSHCWKLAILYP